MGIARPRDELAIRMEVGSKPLDYWIIRSSMMEWLDRAEYFYPLNTKNRQGMDLTIWKSLEGLMVREIFLEGTALMNNGGNLANGGDRYSR